MNTSDRLQYGDFVRVKRDSDFRPGQDGMVMAAEDENGCVGMVFVSDRHCETSYDHNGRGRVHAGVEAWDRGELDLTSRDRNSV